MSMFLAWRWLLMRQSSPAKQQGCSQHTSARPGAACQLTNLLLSSCWAQKQSWGQSPNQHIPTRQREGKKYSCVQLSPTLVNKVTTSPCWILASQVFLPLPCCCCAVDGPSWLHQCSSSASSTSPNTQGTAANLRVLKM